MAEELEHKCHVNQIPPGSALIGVPGLFFYLESPMSRIPQAANKLVRDINEIDVDIRKAIKRGDTQKREDLTWKKGQMLDILTELRYHC